MDNKGTIETMGSDQRAVAGDVVDFSRVGELLETLWVEKIKVVTITLIFSCLSLIYSLYIPNEYESTAILYPKKESGGNSLSRLASQLGGFASLAGVNIASGATDNSKLALEIMGSFGFYADEIYEGSVAESSAFAFWDEETGEAFYDEDLVNPKTMKWLPGKKPTAQQAFAAFSSRISISQSMQTGLISIRARHFSPVIAKEWVELMISKVNTLMRTREIERSKQSIDFLNKKREETNLVDLDNVFAQLAEEEVKKMMLANVSDDFIFEVIDCPVVPEIKVAPSRSVILVVWTILGF